MQAVETATHGSVVAILDYLGQVFAYNVYQTFETSHEAQRALPTLVPIGCHLLEHPLGDEYAPRLAPFLVDMFKLPGEAEFGAAAIDANLWLSMHAGQEGLANPYARLYWRNNHRVLELSAGAPTTRVMLCFNAPFDPQVWDLAVAAAAEKKDRIKLQCSFELAESQAIMLHTAITARPRRGDGV